MAIYATDRLKGLGSSPTTITIKAFCTTRVEFVIATRNTYAHSNLVPGFCWRLPVGSPPRGVFLHENALVYRRVVGTAADVLPGLFPVSGIADPQSVFELPTATAQNRELAS